MASVRNQVDALRAITKTGAIEQSPVMVHRLGEIAALRRRDVYAPMTQHMTDELRRMVKPLYDLAKDEHDVNLDGVKPKDLAEAVSNGSATMFVNATTGETVGYIRLKPRLDARIKDALGIQRNYEILEAGTLIVGENYRKNGLSTKLIQSLMGPNEGRLRGSQLLIIATMETLDTAFAFRSAFFGYSFSLGNHLELEMLAPLTCRCTPPLGTGFQINSDGYCVSRIPHEQTQLLHPILDRSKGKGTRISVPELSIIDEAKPCMFFVSDIDLAMRINDDLRQVYEGYVLQGAGIGRGSGLPDAVAAFRHELVSIGYYQ